MKKTVIALVLLSSLLAMGGCAPLIFGGLGAAGFAGWEYEFRTCVAIADGQPVSRHFARLHPNLAKCVR